MDEASKVLENLLVSRPRLPDSYKKFSPNRPLVDEAIDQNPSPINPNLSECEFHESIPDQPLVEKMVNSIPPSVDRTFPIESELHITQVLLVSSGSNELGDSSPIPTTQGKILRFPQHWT